MNKLMTTLLILAASFSVFGQYSGGGGVTPAQLATKLGTNEVEQTLSGSASFVPSSAATTAGIAEEASARISNDDDLRNAISSGQALQYSFYLATNMYTVGDFSYTPTNNQRFFCATQTTNATSFTYTYAATNTYGFVAFCTNNVFYTNQAGTAYFYDYTSESGSGDIFEKVELYAFTKDGTSVEIGDVAIPLQVTKGSTPLMSIFNIPYQAYSNTNGYYFGIKKKCTSKGSGSNVVQWVGNGYNTHLDLALPSTVLADFYVAKTQIVPTLTGDSSNDVPSVAAVNDGLAQKSDVITNEYTVTGLSVTNRTLIDFTRRTKLVAEYLSSGTAYVVPPIFPSIQRTLKFSAIQQYAHWRGVRNDDTNVTVRLYFAPAETNYAAKIALYVQSMTPSGSNVVTSTVFDNTSVTNGNFYLNYPVPTNHIGNDSLLFRQYVDAPSEAGLTFTTNGIYILGVESQGRDSVAEVLGAFLKDAQGEAW